MRPLLLSVGLVVCPAVAVSQQPVPATLSLADAITLARVNNPAYRQTIHDRAPAAWAARNAYASLVIPTVTASGGLGYSGPGQQRFLTQNFSQSVSTWSSNYNLSLDWALSGQTLSQPGSKHAQLAAADADIAGAETNLVTGVTQQYLTVLQARDNAAVAQQQLDHDEAFLRQLRLFQQIGVAAPVDVQRVQLSDTFAVQAPTWKLNELLTIAEAQNPSLKALRARESAAGWGVKAATGSWGPSVSLSAGWSGFTQKLSDINPTIAADSGVATAAFDACQYENTAWLNTGETPLPCVPWDPQRRQQLVAQNDAYAFHFTPQPFQARLTVSIPLWGNFQQPLQVSQAKAQQQDLQESVRARGLQVQTDVSQAYLILQTAYRATAIQDTNRTAAHDVLQLATERYRVGSGTFFELLDAQVAALRAETDYVSAVYDYHKALAALEAAVGRPLR